MTLSELLPDIQALARSEKLHLIHLLAADVAHEERLIANLKNSSAEIWSPFDATDAAKALEQMLSDDKAAQK
jgi:hypothetical protein